MYESSSWEENCYGRDKSKINPFMHNVVKWPNILKKSYDVNTARFLKYVWPFLNIMHERVKEWNYQYYFLSNNISCTRWSWTLFENQLGSLWQWKMWYILAALDSAHKTSIKICQSNLKKCCVTDLSNEKKDLKRH